MGSALERVAAERGVEVAAVLDRAAMAGDAEARSVLTDVDVALDFSVPAAVVANVRTCLEAGCAVVVGTTGWYDHLDALTEQVVARSGAMLWASNFSLGVAWLTRLVRVAGKLAAPAEPFDAHLVETHHAGKRDAPSGTALTLGQAMEETLGRPVPISSVRVGSVPGTHEVVLDGPFETLRVSHTARDRRVFADGALTAALWLRGRRGVFTMDDVLEGEES